MRGKNYFKNVLRQKNYGGKVSRIVIPLDEGNGTEVGVLRGGARDEPFVRPLIPLTNSSPLSASP